MHAITYSLTTNDRRISKRCLEKMGRAYQEVATSMSAETKRTLEVLALIVAVGGGLSSVGGYFVLRADVARHEKQIEVLEQKSASDKETLLKLTWQGDMVQRDVAEIKALLKALPKQPSP